MDFGSTRVTEDSDLRHGCLFLPLLENVTRFLKMQVNSKTILGSKMVRGGESQFHSTQLMNLNCVRSKIELLKVNHPLFPLIISPAGFMQVFFNNYDFFTYQWVKREQID